MNLQVLKINEDCFMENSNDKNLKSSKEIEYELAVYGMYSVVDTGTDDSEEKENCKYDSVQIENMNYNIEYQKSINKFFILNSII